MADVHQFKVHVQGELEADDRTSVEGLLEDLLAGLPTNVAEDATLRSIVPLRGMNPTVWNATTVVEVNIEGAAIDQERAQRTGGWDFDEDDEHSEQDSDNQIAEDLAQNVRDLIPEPLAAISEALVR